MKAINGKQQATIDESLGKIHTAKEKEKRQKAKTLKCHGERCHLGKIIIKLIAKIKQTRQLSVVPAPLRFGGQPA